MGGGRCALRLFRGRRRGARCVWRRPHISLKSRPYLPHISPVFRLHLGHISPGGAGLGAWGGAGDARGVASGVAAAAGDAGGAFEAPPPNPYRKVVWLGVG